MWMDGRTDRSDETDGRFLQFCECAKNMNDIFIQLFVHSSQAVGDFNLICTVTLFLGTLAIL